MNYLVFIIEAVEDDTVGILIGASVGATILFIFVLLMVAVLMKNKKRQDKVSSHVDKRREGFGVEQDSIMRNFFFHHNSIPTNFNTSIIKH